MTTPTDVPSATYSSSDAEKTDQSPLRGTFAIEPSLVIVGTADGGLIWPGAASSTFVVDIAELQSHVVAPVAQAYGESHLQQVPTEGWERILNPSDGSEEICFHPPVLLSARTNWHLSSNSIEVYNKAYVIDGAQRLEAALRSGRSLKVLVTVVLGISPGSELLLRDRFHESGDSAVRIITEQKFGTSTQRLKIDETLQRIKLQSEPFVMPSAFGYAPAILVRREGSDETRHVIVGARSFSEPLEEFRVRFGKLAGLIVAVRKVGPERSAPYEVNLLDRDG